MKRRGFTLIELLIVIAIIAILALIAVPNFLEAQTRAKVTKVLAHFRNTSLALETYMVDWGAYPSGYRTQNQIKFDKNASFYAYPVEFIGSTLPLSTPVAYLSSGMSMTDPFSKWQNNTENENGGTGLEAGAPVGTLMYQRINPDIFGPSAPASQISAARGKAAYVLFSFGPDQKLIEIIPFSRIDPLTGLIQLTTFFNIDVVIPQLVPSIYDPTNGTQSAGDIFAFGGDAIGLSQGKDSIHGK